MADCLKFLFLFVVFDVRIWLAKALFLLILPLPVTEKRFAAPRCVLIFGIPSPLFLFIGQRTLRNAPFAAFILQPSPLPIQPSLFGSKNHDHVASLQPWLLINHTVIDHGLLYGLHQPPTDVGIGYFPAPEHHRHFDLVMLLQKSLDVLHLDVAVMLLGFWPQANLLHLDNRLALFGDLHLLALLIPEFPIIHNPAHRRIRHGRNLNQIQSRFCRFRQRLVQGNDPKLFALIVDNPDRCGFDLPVYA